MENKKYSPDRLKYIAAFALAMIVITVFFFLYGNGKRITFCDEIYTYNIVNSRGLTPYQINSWMSGADFNNAMTHDDGDSYEQLIENVKIDMVHPPFYYILMYISSKFAGNKMSVWTGLAVNFIGYIGTAVIIFLVLKRLFNNYVISSLGTIGVMLTQCMISDAMLIRMYMIYTFFTALLAYANLLIRQKNSILNYAVLCISIVGGFLTQYYFIFFVCLFFAFEIIYDVKDRNFKGILKYTAVIIVSALIINKVWGFWYEALSSSTHSAGIISNAKNFLSNLGKIYSGYELVMYSVFQRAGKVFMVILPLLVVALLYFIRKEKKSLLREFVIELAGVALMYAFIVNVLTPDYLSSTRYYYADMMLVAMLYVICILGIINTIVVKNDLKEIFIYSASGLLVIMSNIALLLTGYGVDYYADTKQFDGVTQALESYKDIPWVIGWDNSWQLDASMEDYIIPSRVIPVSANGTVEEGTFDGVDEFILVQSGTEVSEFITQRNLSNFISSTKKNVNVEKIASRDYVSYYYCTVDGRAEDMKGLVKNNKDTLWIVIDNDGWYDEQELFSGEKPGNILFIEDNTPYDTTGKYSGYDHVIILTSLLGEDVKDVGTYYMIGSTGKFFGSSYIGIFGNGKIIAYSCDIVE